MRCPNTLSLLGSSTSILAQDCPDAGVASTEHTITPTQSWQRNRTDYTNTVSGVSIATKGFLSGYPVRLVDDNQ